MTGPFVNEIEATAEAIVSGYGRTENGTLLSNWKRKPRNEGNGKGEKLDLRGWWGGCDGVLVAVQEISSTLFIDSDEACIKSDFSIPF